MRKTFFGGFGKPIMVFGAFAVLLLGQPDLGTAVVMLVTLFGMLFIAGAGLSQFIALMGGGNKPRSLIDCCRTLPCSTCDLILGTLE